MARADWVSIGLCLLAVVLVEATSVRTSFAEEAPAKSEHQPAAESKGGNADHAAGGGAGKPEGNPTNSAGQQTGQGKGSETGQELDRSDSRIAVEPHAPPTRMEDGKGPKAMLRSFTHGNGQTHQRLATRPSEPVVRNAIGIVVGPHENIVHRDGRVAPLVVRGPAGATGAGGGIAKTSGIPETNKFAHPVPTPGPVPAHRATISGTGLMQRGSGPSQIGGPAKSVAGISGTNVRPKH
jgi:hypothetical protein